LTGSAITLVHSAVIGWTKGARGADLRRRLLYTRLRITDTKVKLAVRKIFLGKIVRLRSSGSGVVIPNEDWISGRTMVADEEGRWIHEVSLEALGQKIQRIGNFFEQGSSVMVKHARDDVGGLH
jgi:hypothetical protein